MERIDPLADHLHIMRFRPGERVKFHGKEYSVQRRTTLASGEPALVLQGEAEQFVIGAARFLAGFEGKARA